MILPIAKLSSMMFPDSSGHVWRGGRAVGCARVALITRPNTTGGADQPTLPLHGDACWCWCRCRAGLKSGVNAQVGGGVGFMV